MTLPTRLFYTLEEAAKLWNKEEGELLQWGASGDLNLGFYQRKKVKAYEVSVLFTNEQREIDISDVYLYADGKDIKALLAGHSIEYSYAYATADIAILTKGDIKEGSYLLLDYRELEAIEADFTPPSITKDDLVVLSQDLQSIEEKFPELIGKRGGCGGPRVERSDLHIIGALLQIIMDGGKFRSEAQLKDLIAEDYKGYEGCTVRTLSDRFKQAKDLLQNFD